MARKNILMVSPTGEMAQKRFNEAYDYVLTHFPIGYTLELKKMQIIVGEEKHSIKFISESEQEKYTMGFRGSIVSAGNKMDVGIIQSIINETLAHDTVEPPKVEPLKILVISNDGLHRMFEDLVQEVSNKFDSYQVRRSDWSIIINQYHRIGFCDSDWIKDYLKEYDVILTEKSFQKYKTQILEAMR